jgi:hypothetical protein
MNSMSPGPYWAKGIGDTTAYRYDPILKRYICDAKHMLILPKEEVKRLGLVLGRNKDRIRLRAMAESEDFIHWTRPRFFLYPDDNDQPDCQIYSHIGFVYESMWIGLVRVMHMIPTGWKQVDVQLTYSRDGRHWCRPRRRQPFIPLGDPDGWEPDYTGPSTNGPLLVDDEIWIYYRGCRYARRDDPKAKDTYKMAIGLAALRRDGFVSLDAGETPGQIVTRPLTFGGKSLFVNADVGDDGWIKAAVLSEGSESTASYTLDDAVPVTENTTKSLMRWKTRKKLAPPHDGHIRLLFQLKDAKLYSFGIE